MYARALSIKWTFQSVKFHRKYQINRDRSTCGCLRICCRWKNQWDLLTRWGGSDGFLVSFGAQMSNDVCVATRSNRKFSIAFFANNYAFQFCIFQIRVLQTKSFVQFATPFLRWHFSALNNDNVWVHFQLKLRNSMTMVSSFNDSEPEWDGKQRQM